MWLIESDGVPLRPLPQSSWFQDLCVYDQEDGGRGVVSLSKKEVMMSPLPVICRSQSSLGQHISKSPFEVNVDKAQGDASKVTAKGPGLEAAGNIANKPTYFDIYTAGTFPSSRAGDNP